MNRSSQKKDSYVFCHFWYKSVGRNVGLCVAKGVCGIVSKRTEGIYIYLNYQHMHTVIKTL